MLLATERMPPPLLRPTHARGTKPHPTRRTKRLQGAARAKPGTTHRVVPRQRAAHQDWTDDASCVVDARSGGVVASCARIHTHCRVQGAARSSARCGHRTDVRANVQAGGMATRRRPRQTNHRATKMAPRRRELAQHEQLQTSPPASILVLFTCPVCSRGLVPVCVRVRQQRCSGAARRALACLRSCMLALRRRRLRGAWRAAVARAPRCACMLRARAAAGAFRARRTWRATRLR